MSTTTDNSSAIAAGQNTNRATPGAVGVSASEPRIGRAWSGPWRGRSLLERFEQKFIPEPNSGCWLWIGAIDGIGYGRFRAYRRLDMAHRVAYRLYVGQIPAGMEIDHRRCDNPLCVNPEHLEPATHRHNVMRGRGSCAANARKTHCIRGHELPPFKPGMQRICRICRRSYIREYMRAKRAANA
jgi:hypothetical protein